VWWANNLLEFEMFNTADAYHLFYERAKEAATLPVRDALEVFYIAVVLGFRGLYRDPGLARIEAEPRQLPHTLEDWAKHTVRGITFTEGPVIEPGGQMGAGAPPLDGLLWFTLSAAVTAALAALVTATFVFRMGWLPG
jgi:type VI secretion system protein ImpK